jgi:DNA/RNA endonuclease G (NUC1)
MQANYVRYISTSGGNGCKGCDYFRVDPYGIDTLKDIDYRNTKYDRGHLVPNADYGYDTYIINNAVPMEPNFNQKVWAKLENYIRKEYSGSIIYKGCDYTDNFILSESGRKLYIPQGCYYVVLDLDNKLKDYGYYSNEKDSSQQSLLPSWISC